MSEMSTDPGNCAIRIDDEGRLCAKRLRARRRAHPKWRARDARVSRNNGARVFSASRSRTTCFEVLARSGRWLLGRLATLWCLGVLTCLPQHKEPGSSAGKPSVGDQMPTSDDTSEADPTFPGAGSSWGETGTGSGNKKLSSGLTCEHDDNCKTGICRFPPDGSDGVCSECVDREDCVNTGSGIACILMEIGPNRPFYACGDGGYGEPCEMDEECAEGHCAERFAGGGTFACGECTTDPDCTTQAQGLCISSLFGSRVYRKCAEAGELADGVVCELQGSGEEACANHCVETEGLGDALGTCGECRPDHADCPEGEVCTTATFGNSAKCVDP